MSTDRPRRTSRMVPVLAVIVAGLSFWVAQVNGSWPMAFAGLAAWLLALSYIRLPRRTRPEAEVEVVAFDLDSVSDPIAVLESDRPIARISR